MGHRVGWLAAWLAIAGAGVYLIDNPIAPAVAVLCVLIGAVGFFRLRWKDAPFRFEEHKGSAFVGVSFKPGAADSVLCLRIKHPPTARVIGYTHFGKGKTVMGGESFMDPSMKSVGSLRSRRSRSFLTVRSEFEPDDRLAVYLQRDDGGSIGAGELVLWRER